MSKTMIPKNVKGSLKKDVAAHMPTATCCDSMPMNECAVPTCTMRFEDSMDGCKVHCVCHDETAILSLQRLCRMLEGGVCTMTCCCDGEPCLRCNFDMCECDCEMTADGMCMSCTCTDSRCIAMVRAMCHSLCTCCANGCECTMCINDVPVCRCCC